MAIQSAGIQVSSLFKRGFVLLGVLVVLMGTLGFFRASDAGKSFGTAMDHRYPKITALHAIHDRAMASSALQRDMLLLSDVDDIRKAAQTMAALQKENAGVLAQWDLASTSEKERALFKAVSDARAQYLVVCQRFLDQALAGERELAKSVLQTEMAPVEQTYFAALAAMGTFQEAQMQSANAHAASAITQIQTTLVASGAIALLMATMAVIWSSRAVPQPTCQAAAAVPRPFGKPSKEGDLRVAVRPQQQATPPKFQPVTKVPVSVGAGSPVATAKGASAGGDEQWASF